jgi:hypothetical protein
MQPEDRLICIFHPSIKPAGPLNEFDRVVAEPDSILKMYRTLLCEPGAIPGMKPINPNLTDGDLLPHVAALIAQIQPTPKLKRRYYTSYLDLRLHSDKPISSRDSLLESHVIASLNMKGLFGTALLNDQDILEETDIEIPSDTNPILLSDVVDFVHLEDDNSEWLDALAHALENVFQKHTPETIDTVFRGADRRLYVPILQAIRQRSHDGSLVSAHIVFYEKITGPLLRAPRNLEALAIALRLGYRFRWEIIEVFCNMTNKTEIAELRRVLERMERESRQRSLMRPDAESASDFRKLPLVQAFDTNDQETVIGMYIGFLEFRNKEGTGRLDIAIAKKQPDDIVDCLAELKIMNRKFMRIGAKRYSQLVDIEWTDVSS